MRKRVITRVVTITAVLLLFATPAWAVTAYVQDNASFTPASASGTVALTANVTPPNCVVGMVTVFTNGASVLSVTSQGFIGTAVTVHNDTVITGNMKATLFYIYNTSGTGNTIQVSLTGNDDFDIWAMEVSGCTTTDPIDGSTIASITNPETGSNAITSGTINPSFNGDFFYGQVIANTGGESYTAGTDFTLRHNGTGDANESYVQSVGAAHAATFTGSNGTHVYGVAVMAIKAADGTPISGGARPCIIGGGFFGSECP